MSSSSSDKTTALLLRIRNNMLDRSTPVGKAAADSTNKMDLAKFFREIDSNGDNSISLAEFRECLSRKFGLNKHESDSLFALFNTDANGAIDFKEFIDHLHTSLPPRRFNIVKHVFEYIDSNNSGVITHTDFVGHGKKEEEKKQKGVVGAGTDSKNKIQYETDEAIKQFFEKALGKIQHDHDSRVTFSEFVAHCESLSTRIKSDEDDVFAHALCKVWNISSPSEFMYVKTKRVEDMDVNELRTGFIEARERIVKLNQRLFEYLKPKSTTA